MAKPPELSAAELAAVSRRLERLGQDLAKGQRRPASFNAIAEAIRESTGVKMSGQTVANMSHGAPGTYAREKLTTLERYLGESLEDWLSAASVQVATPPQRTTELDERYPVVAIVLNDARRSGWSEDDIDGARVRLLAFKGQPSEDDVWHALRASRSGRMRGVSELESTKAVEAAERTPNLKPAKKRGKR